MVFNGKHIVWGRPRQRGMGADIEWATHGKGSGSGNQSADPSMLTPCSAGSLDSGPTNPSSQPTSGEHTSSLPTPSLPTPSLPTPGLTASSLYTPSPSLPTPSPLTDATSSLPTPSPLTDATSGEPSADPKQAPVGHSVSSSSCAFHDGDAAEDAAAHAQPQEGEPPPAEEAQQGGRKLLRPPKPVREQCKQIIELLEVVKDSEEKARLADRLVDVNPYFRNVLRGKSNLQMAQGWVDETGEDVLAI